MGMIPKSLEKINRVCIATPCYGNSVTSQYLHSYGLTVEALTRYGVEVNLITVESDALIERARNQCVHEFIEMNCDYLIFIDADIGWQPIDLIRLLGSGKEFCGMAYPAKTDERRFVCNIIKQNPFIVCHETNFVKADHIGTGMMVLKKDAIIKMNHYHMSEGKWYRDWKTNNPVAKMFEVALSSDGDNHLWSEDYVFCQKWKNLGGDIWIYPDGWLKHYGGKVWLDCLSKTND